MTTTVIVMSDLGGHKKTYRTAKAAAAAFARLKARELELAWRARNDNNDEYDALWPPTSLMKENWNGYNAAYALATKKWAKYCADCGAIYKSAYDRAFRRSYPVFTKLLKGIN